MIRSCLDPATRFSTTPTIRTPGSNAWQPSTHAATVRVTFVALTTRTTGASSAFASSAVLWVPSASAPSNRPRLPSITAKSAPAVCVRKACRTAGTPIRKVSRLRAGRPDAHASQAASM